MTDKKLKYFDILAAKKAYREGRNVTEVLRSQKSVTENTPEIIETAYDLQAGTYSEYVQNNPVQASLYAAELAAILEKYIGPQDSLLDVGTGELTTLGLLTKVLSRKPKKILAFDISWSRVFKGLSYAKREMGADYERLTPFVADIREIPLLDKAVSVTTSSHALEPNGGNLRELMEELFRVTADKLVLFEPCYEINSEEGKRRMDQLGYIKNVDGVVRDLGGVLVDKIKIKNINNPLNPTVCFVITPPAFPDKNSKEKGAGGSIFSVPGTSYMLKDMDSFYYSRETGLCFPTLKSIPILKSSAAILASALDEQFDSAAET